MAAVAPSPAFVVGWSECSPPAASPSPGAFVFAEFLTPLLPPIPGGVTTIAVTLILAFGLLLWNGVKSGDIAQQLVSGAKALAFRTPRRKPTETTGEVQVASLAMPAPAAGAPPNAPPEAAPLAGT